MNGRLIVRHRIYQDQTVGPRSANFDKHMLVDKSKFVYQFSSRQSPWNLFSCKKLHEVYSEVHSWLFRKMLTDQEKIMIYNTLSRICGFDWHIYLWPWSTLKVKGKVKVTHDAHFDSEYLANDLRQGWYQYCHQIKKSHMGFILE